MKRLALPLAVIGFVALLFAVGWYLKMDRSGLIPSGEKERTPVSTTTHSPVTSTSSGKIPDAYQKFPIPPELEAFLPPVSSDLLSSGSSQTPSIPVEMLLEQAVSGWSVREVFDPSELEVLKAIISAWILKNLEAAPSWVEGLKLGVIKKLAIEDLADQWASTSLEQATQWAEGLPEGAYRRNAFKRLSERWVGIQPEKALKLIHALEPESRDKQLDELAMALAIQGRNRARSNVDEALAWARNLPLSNPSSIMGGIIYEMTGIDLQRAVTLAETLPEGFGRDLAFSGIIYAWTTNDHASVRTWLSGLPRGRSRDVAWSKYIIERASEEPDRAAEWVEEIDGPDIKDHTLVQVRKRSLRMRENVVHSPTARPPADQKETP